MPEIKVTAEWRAREREGKALRKDIQNARKIIADGLARYRKKMLHAKSLKQAEDRSMFDVLDDYRNKEDIQEAFGWGCITDSEMRRLWNLWDVRERVAADSGRYSDRVTQILERAIDNCGDKYTDALEEFEALQRQDNEERIRIERENNINDYNRYHAGL
jgi:hypothetical protein